MIRVPLDENGNVAGTVLVWPNDQLTPANSYYTVNVYRKDGRQVALAPQYQTVPSSPSPFNISAWVPNSPPPLPLPASSLTLQTNEINNGSQALLDLHAGSNITPADNGSGRVTITGAGTTLKTNGTLNGSQSLLNLQQGSNITLADNGAGTVTIAGTSQSQVGPRPSFGNWRGWTYSGGNGIQAAYGCVPNWSSSGTTAGVAATATDPCYLQVSTGTTAGGVGIVCANENQTSNNIGLAYQELTLGILACWQTRIQLTSTTTQRVWLGIGNISGFGPLNGETPQSIFNGPQNICLFRYSTNAGDTTWKAYVGTTSGNQTIVDTGVTPDTNGHNFQITYDGTHVNFWIDLVLKAQISTNVPATNVRMQDVCYVDNLTTTNIIKLNVAYQYWETKM